MNTSHTHFVRSPLSRPENTPTNNNGSLHTAPLQLGSIDWQGTARTTSIPRPVSGTSRSASSRPIPPIRPTNTSRSPTDGMLSPNYDTQLPHTSTRPPNASYGMPPSSYPKFKSILPQSASLQPAVDLSKADPQRANEKKNIRRDSVKELEGLKNIARPALATTLGILKPNLSKTSDSKPKKREITPVSLLRPIQPSIPQTQLATLSACSSPNRWSPLKPSHPGTPRRLSKAKDEDKPEVDEQTSLRAPQHQVLSSGHINDKIIHQPEYGSVVRSVSHTTKRSISSTKTTVKESKGKMSAIHSLNRTSANHGKPLDLRGPDGTGPLSVDTRLANTIREHKPSLLSGKNFFESSSSELSPNLKNVYQAKDVGYWIGRYSAVTDRIRKTDCENLLRPHEEGSNPLSINSEEFDQEFDKLEETRMTRALGELRRDCKTSSALKSFELLEKKLKKKETKLSQVFLRSSSDISREPNQDSLASLEAGHDIKGIRQYSGNNSTSQITTLNAQATIQPISRFVGGKSGLVKSKTTGDLGSKPTSKRVPTPGLHHTTNEDSKDFRLSQFLKMSQPKQISDPRLNAIKEREARLKLDGGASIAPNTMEADALIDNDKHRKASEIAFTRTAGLSSHPSQISGLNNLAGQVGRGTVIAPGLTAAALEAGHRVPPPIPPKRFLNREPTSEGSSEETSLYQIRRGNRTSSTQSSGEFVKKVVGAGIREVRKMGRRVGNMGWGNSGDDDDQNA